MPLSTKHYEYDIFTCLPRLISNVLLSILYLRRNIVSLIDLRIFYSHNDQAYRLMRSSSGVPVRVKREVMSDFHFYYCPRFLLTVTLSPPIPQLSVSIPSITTTVVSGFFPRTFWKHILKVSAQKLDSIEGHFALLFLSIIEIHESNGVVVIFDDTSFGDGQTANVSSEVLQKLRGTEKHGFAVDPPRLVPYTTRKLHVRQRLFGIRHEFTSKQAGKGLNRHQKVRMATTPTACDRIISAARHDAMDMRMIDHGTTPGVQHRQNADLCARYTWDSGPVASEIGRCRFLVFWIRFTQSGEWFGIGRLRENTPLHACQICPPRFPVIFLPTLGYPVVVMVGHI